MAAFVGEGLLDRLPFQSGDAEGQGRVVALPRLRACGACTACHRGHPRLCPRIPSVAPLATVRRRSLLSQRALASKAGVALSTIYLLEAGKTERTTFKVMRAVSEALGVAPASIAEFRRAIEAE